jgi:tetratricopeptide (TPR) repeat protein
MDLGIARLLQDNYAGAEEALLRALELDRKEFGAWMALAASRYESYQFATAAENLIIAIELGQKELMAYSNLCELCLRNNLAITDIKHIVVDNESDALLLENNIIKKHQPRYNILLKDDKTFPWICIKKEPFPRYWFHL